MSGKILIHCKACGNGFFVKPSHVNPNGQCCSMACRSVGHFEMRDCPECGKQFRVERNQALTSRGGFCSRACRQLANAPDRRFWAKVNKNGPVPSHVPELGPCWVWTGAVDDLGYGFFRVSKRENMRKTHRLSWIMEHCDPGDLLVLHKCDNPSCVRPDHLFLGTNQDNCDDKFRKGRAGSPRGEQRRRSVLTENNVREIRASDATAIELAARFGVGRSSIKKVRARETWKHVP